MVEKCGEKKTVDEHVEDRERTDFTMKVEWDNLKSLCCWGDEGEQHSKEEKRRPAKMGQSENNMVEQMNSG